MSESKDEMYGQTIQSILTMNRTLRMHAKAINSEEISGRQLATLSHLAETGECTAGALARGLYINESSMSENLRKLKQKGLITKVRSEMDNRVVTVAITEAGRELVNRLPPGGILLLRRRLKQLDLKELRAINKAVGKLNKLMEAE